MLGEAKAVATLDDRNMLDMALMMLLGTNKSQFVICCPDKVMELVQRISGSGPLLKILANVERTRTNEHLKKYIPTPEGGFVSDP